ncbi:hypothetical protein NL676_026726 [Syzygium grande]|nr:hypothetical protein NL676_026726 [Syzygium grande]
MGNCRLKVLHLVSCRRLIKTPSFSTCLTLERLVVKDCGRLVEIDPSICMLLHLKHLEINGCNGVEREKKGPEGRRSSGEGWGGGRRGCREVAGEKRNKWGEEDGGRSGALARRRVDQERRSFERRFEAAAGLVTIAGKEGSASIKLEKKPKQSRTLVEEEKTHDG